MGSSGSCICLKEQLLEVTQLLGTRPGLVILTPGPSTKYGGNFNPIRAIVSHFSSSVDCMDAVCFTPLPIRTIGQMSPTREMDKPCRRPIVLGQSPFCDTEVQHIIRQRTQSKHFKTYAHHRSSSSDDTSSSNSSLEDELRALPEPPAGLMRNLSRLVTRAQRQFKPYDLRQGHTPNAIELRFVHRSLGKYSGETDMNLVDVQEGKEIFERGLRGMSQKTITQAIVAKQATRESMRLRVLTTAWEIESGLQRMKLLECILEQDALEYGRSIAEASHFQRHLVGGNKQELEASVDFNVGVHSHDLASFAVADVQLDHIEGLARKLCLPEEDPPQVVKGQSSPGSGP
ncbi:hypothetical protein EV424DRAFT_1346780 [Suillus variegatus]|nr:hypothetical protein EV424DRAFT_1346780 [Suillus variegatus]